MFRTLIVSLGVVAAAGIIAGCGGSSGPGGSKPSGERITEAADKIKEGAKEAAAEVKQGLNEASAKTKEHVVKPIVDAYPGIEAKIKTMSGDAAKTAGEKFEALKRKVEEFKTAEKWEDLKVGLYSQYEELKKLLGL